MDKIRMLIVEDEPPVARYIERCCRSILKGRIESLATIHSLREALTHVSRNPVDLCLLDLNLKGASGYNLLRSAVSGSFHTIIISAHTDQALEAFKYGVLDFVPKPFAEEELRAALERYFQLTEDTRQAATRYLTTRKGNENVVFQVDEVLYFQAADVYVEARFFDGRTELISKSMNRLEQILPADFFRIHRSYLARLSQIQSYSGVIDGSCQVTLKTGHTLPLSRRRRADLQHRLDLS
jgi:DNA-binding LytR/AlgR family response regulator